MVEEFVPYLTLWRLKASWAYTIACGLTNPVWWFYLFWFPGFIATRYHLTTVRAGFYTSIVYIMATVGSIAGGWFSSMLLNRGWSVNSARKLALLIPALCVLPVFAAASMPNVWGTVLLVGIAGAAHQAWAANLYTFVSDIMPKRAVSSVVGFGGFSGGLLSMAAAQATGLVLTAYHSYVPIFYACSTMYVISFLFIHFMVPVIGTHHGPSSLVAETDAG
jgi:ACS family hexuronate transporter-like MFS transporter